MSFAFNFQIDDSDSDSQQDNNDKLTTQRNSTSSDASTATASATVEASTETTESTTTSAASDDAKADLVPGQRLLLDESQPSLDIRVPTVPLIVPLADEAKKEFIKVDEERAEIGQQLMDILFDDDSRTQTDLVPGRYEGGLKVWEASLDLVRYLHRMNVSEHHPLFHNTTTTSAPTTESAATTQSDAETSKGESNSTAAPTTATAMTLVSDTKDKEETESPNTAATVAPIRVLELGCGHGYPGIYALQEANVDFCVFSDYNESVLRSVTWPTVLLNCVGQGKSQPNVDLRFRAHYYAGDWVRHQRVAVSRDIT